MVKAQHTVAIRTALDGAVEVKQGLREIGEAGNREMGKLAQGAQVAQRAFSHQEENSERMRKIIANVESERMSDATRMAQLRTEIQSAHDTVQMMQNQGSTELKEAADRIH